MTVFDSGVTNGLIPPLQITSLDVTSVMGYMIQNYVRVELRD